MFMNIPSAVGENVRWGGGGFISFGYLPHLFRRIAQPPTSTFSEANSSRCNSPSHLSHLLSSRGGGGRSSSNLLDGGEYTPKSIAKDARKDIVWVRFDIASHELDCDSVQIGRKFLYLKNRDSTRSEPRFSFG